MGKLVKTFFRMNVLEKKKAAKKKAKKEIKVKIKELFKKPSAFGL